MISPALDLAVSRRWHVCWSHLTFFFSEVSGVFLYASVRCEKYFSHASVVKVHLQQLYSWPFVVFFFLVFFLTFSWYSSESKHLLFTLMRYSLCLSFSHSLCLSYDFFFSFFHNTFSAWEQLLIFWGTEPLVRRIVSFTTSLSMFDYYPESSNYILNYI